MYACVDVMDLGLSYEYKLVTATISRSFEVVLISIFSFSIFFFYSTYLKVASSGRRFPMNRRQAVDPRLGSR